MFFQKGIATLWLKVMLIITLNITLFTFRQNSVFTTDNFFG